MKRVSNPNRDIKSNILEFFRKNRGIVITIILSGLAFVAVFRMVSPVNINNMGGAHSWLSGSTIKFVNNWLEEGAANLNFTNYEDPASIEFQTLEEREPYLSYPSGETFFVYSAARLLGKNQITISFLHKFQIVMFAIEAMLLAVFVYYFLERTVKLKNILERILISVLTAVLWVILPICSYYLSGIYYADQCVILWVMGILLVEYLIRTGNARKKTGLKILRSILLYSGILVDYYFWFLAFLFFVAEIWETILKYKETERKKRIWSIIGWYGIPTLLALGTYYIQLTMTNEWFNVMMDRFNERVVGGEKTLGWIFDNIFSNFAQAFSLNNGMIYWLIVIMLILFLGGAVYLIKNKKILALIKNPGLSIVTCNILAIILQIYFFKQHSAVHEFSMIKVGWIVAILPILMMLLCGYLIGIKNIELLKIRKTSIDSAFLVFLVNYLIIFIVTGVPISTQAYISTRAKAEDYSFETMLRENLDRSQVVFSYSEDIPINPPQSLAISRKRVYKIKEVDEIVAKMDNLPKEAKTVLVINKEAELNDVIRKQLQCLKDNGEVRYQDSKYILLDLNNYEICRNR